MVWEEIVTVEPRHVLQCFGDESQDLSYSAAGERKKEGRKEKKEREGGRWS